MDSAAQNGTQELKLFEHEGGPLIQVEVNLEEAPLFASNRRNRNEGSIEARNTVVTREGDRLEQYWKVTASPDFGLPGPLDQDVFVAVMRLVNRLGGIPPDGKIRFSVYELIELMNRTHAGSNYEDVREALDRLAASSIYSENAFYSKEDEDFKSLRFHLWEVAFRKRKHRDRAAEQHTLKFSEVLSRSFNASYLKSLDSEFYYALRRDLAKSLYKLIDVKRRDTLAWTIELHQLRQLIAMPPSYKHPSTIKRQLEPAHRELVDKGYLVGVEVEERGKGRAKQHIVRYRVSQKFVREHNRSTPKLSERESTVVGRLVSKGVWTEIANDLVGKHGADHCLYYLDALPYQKDIRNPGAWLKKYVENGWPVRVPDEALDPEPRLPESVVGNAVQEARVPDPDPAALQVWEQVLGDLYATFETSNLQTWFESAVPISLGEDGVLTLWTPNPFAQEYIERRFKNSLEASLISRVSDCACIVIIHPESAPVSFSPPKREEVSSEVERRRGAGDFDDAIKAFETVPYDEYKDFVGRSIRHADGERFYLTIDGELYIYAGGRDPDCRHYLCTLKR
jgi:hypothetical protein